MSNWIKCSERLPESCGHNAWSKSKQVYVMHNDCQFTAVLNTETTTWHCFFSNRVISSVTHWSDLMPSPRQL